MFRGPKYAQELRVIGQSLEEMHVKAFDIKREGKDYVILGYLEAPEPVESQYTTADIEHVDRERRGMRSNPSGMPDFRSLPQLLRAIGYYLEHKEGRLMAISRQSGAVAVITIQYETAQRRQKEEEYLPSDLYDLGLRMYKQRKSN